MDAEELTALWHVCCEFPIGLHYKEITGKKSECWVANAVNCEPNCACGPLCSTNIHCYFLTCRTRAWAVHTVPWVWRYQDQTSSLETAMHPSFWAELTYPTFHGCPRQFAPARLWKALCADSEPGSISRCEPHIQPQSWYLCLPSRGLSIRCM